MHHLVCSTSVILCLLSSFARKFTIQLSSDLKGSSRTKWIRFKLQQIPTKQCRINWTLSRVTSRHTYKHLVQNPKSKSGLWKPQNSWSSSLNTAIPTSSPKSETWSSQSSSFLTMPLLSLTRPSHPSTPDAQTTNFNPNNLTTLQAKSCIKPQTRLFVTCADCCCCGTTTGLRGD